jgi:putative toxin-antitoxin system antitoxin component (TIGR02293 family)
MAQPSKRGLPGILKTHCQGLTFGVTMSDRMVNELHAVIEELGGEPVLGRSMRTETDLQAAIREGFPQLAVDEVMRAAGITLKELATSLDLSARSLQRRRRAGRLARYESDRLYRLARIIALAKHYLGNEETATRWLKRPNRVLGGKSPLELIDTELGARTVENIIGRIAYGGVS